MNVNVNLYFVFPEGEPIRVLDSKYVDMLKVGETLDVGPSNHEGIDDKAWYRVKSIEHFFDFRSIKKGNAKEDILDYSGRYFILEEVKDTSPQPGCATN
jgi:hypothetical protein